MDVKNAMLKLNRRLHKVENLFCCFALAWRLTNNFSVPNMTHIFLQWESLPTIIYCDFRMMQKNLFYNVSFELGQGVLKLLNIAS